MTRPADIDFAPVRRAQIKPSDLSRLIGVGRVTCSYWINGHQQPHYLHRAKVKALVDAIAAATESGQFPIPLEVMRRERAHYIRRTLRQVAKR